MTVDFQVWWEAAGGLGRAPADLNCVLRSVCVCGPWNAGADGQGQGVEVGSGDTQGIPG